MLPVKILVGIFAEVGKHCPIVHMVTVDHAVVGKFKVAVFLHIGNAVIAVLLFKIAFKIVIRVVYGLHNGIVDVCPVNGNPTHKVAVLLIDRRILFKSGLLRLRGFGFLRHIGGRRFVRYKRRDSFKCFGTLLFVGVLTIEHKAGEKEKGGTSGRPDHQIFAFHRTLSSCVGFKKRHRRRTRPRRVLSS